MGEWRELSLREAGVVLIDCDHRTPAAIPNGYPYVAIPQLSDGHIDVSSARRISREDFEAWTRKARPATHDVVLSRRTNPGVTAFVPEGLDFALGQNLVLLRSDGQTVHPPFLRWLVRGPAWWGQIERFLNVGAVFDSLKCADVPNFRLDIPPMEQQRSVAEILGVIDDKIELNRRMSDTLEAAGRAMYRSWRDAQVDRDFRLIGDACRLLSGGTPSKSLPQLWSGSIPWISPKVMASIHCDEPDAYVTQHAIGNGTRLAPAGATLVMVRGMGLHEGVRVSQARVDVTFNQDVKALVPGEIEPALLLFAVLDAQESLHEKVESSGHGTGVLATDVLTSCRSPLPDLSTRRSIARQLTVVNDRIAVARDQARALAAIRDALLPRLLSGRLPC